MRYRRQDLFSEFFGKQPRALGLTGRAKVSRLTGESKQMLVLAGRAANPSEASMKSSTIQKGVYRGSDHTSQRSRLGFEPLLVGVDVVVEVLLKQAVEGGSLGVPRSVDS